MTFDTKVLDTMCSSCGKQDNIYLATTLLCVRLDGTVLGGRTAGFCNNVTCDQRYWYYPRSGRITKRNTGITAEEWRMRQTDIFLFNNRRRDEGLPTVEIAPFAAPPMPPFEIVHVDPLPSVTDRLFEWWYMVRAFFVVYVPGFGRFSVGDDND